MQSRRLKEKTSKHWVSFWGTRAAVGAEPLILQKSSLDSSFEPDSASTFRSLASFGDDVPEAVVILTEAIFAVGLRAFRNPSREMAKALGILEDDAVSWRGTNVQFPTADNTTFRGTSEEQAAKGRIGAPAAAKAKRDKRIADLLAGELEVSALRRKLAPAQNAE